MSSSPKRPKMFRTVSQCTARTFVFLALLSFAMSAAAGVIAVRAVQGEIRAKASVVQLCEAGNAARAQQVQLWTHIITISAPPPRQTPAQQRARAELIAGFKSYVHQVFAARDCTHFTGG